MKYTFVVSVNDAYMFGLAATMNAMKFVGTNADFNIIYDGLTDTLRESMTQEFPFPVIWHKLSDIVSQVEVTAKNHPINKFWVTPWFLGSKLLDTYDAVCILQADEFLMANVNSLFRAAAMTDIVIGTEYTIPQTEVEDLPFGTTRSILHRGHYALYDQLVFCGKANKQIFIDTYQAQIVDRWMEDSEVDQPMCALSQSCATHLTNDRIIGLDAHVWAWDRDDTIFVMSYNPTTKRMYNERKIRLHGIHTKVWWDGVVSYAVNAHKAAGAIDKVRCLCLNYNLQRDIMLEYNRMTPATANIYCTNDKWEIN